MSFLDSLGVSLFGISVVFVVLIALSAVVTIQSKLVNAFKIRVNVPAKPVRVTKTDGNIVAAAQTDTAAGELKLIDVEERTAAIIMAIVSHESQIPLSELQFKSIKAVE